MIGNTRDIMKAKLYAHYSGAGATAQDHVQDLLKRYIADNPTFRNIAAHKQYYMTKLTGLGVTYAITETTEDLANKYWNAYV
jgi:hypothetical protein